MPAGFIGYLVFSFVFFGVWCLKDAACQIPSRAMIKPLIVGLVFVAIGYVIWIR
jgi:Ca2+/Na+ antiporter